MTGKKYLNINNIFFLKYYFVLIQDHREKKYSIALL